MGNRSTPWHPRELPSIVVPATVLPSYRELVRRLPRCLFGLACFGLGISMIVRGDLGASPWDVFHLGLSKLTDVGLGTVLIIVSFIVLLLWIPLRQRVGIGTILNALEIGFTVDLILPHLPDTSHLVGRLAYLACGTLVVALGSGFYIGSGLGAGPRDGLVVGLNERFGWSIRASRTTVEIIALLAGWALGGKIGIGTLFFALTIGPLAQIAIKHLRMAPLPGAAVVAASR